MIPASLNPPFCLLRLHQTHMPTSSSEFVPAALLPGLVHAVAVVGQAVWVCTGDGKVALYDAATGEQTVKVRRSGLWGGGGVCGRPGLGAGKATRTGRCAAGAGLKRRAACPVCHQLVP